MSRTKPLSDAEYNLFKSILDVTDRDDCDGNDIRSVCETWFSADEDEWANERAFIRAWNHADYLNEKHNEDHISFCVIRYCQNYYVLNNVEARKLKLIN